jgi:hypothetical protein
MVVYILIVVVVVIIYSYNKSQYFYITDVLDDSMMSAIQTSINQYSYRIVDNTDTVHRVRYVYLDTSPLTKLMYSPEMIKIISDITGIPVRPTTITPVEYREYHKGGFMAKHSDTVLAEPAQIEAVFTVTNTSDSTTILYTIPPTTISTIPGSVLIVRGGGVEHAVTAITKGIRSIIKVMYECGN